MHVWEEIPLPALPYLCAAVPWMPSHRQCLWISGYGPRVRSPCSAGVVPGRQAAGKPITLSLVGDGD